VPLNEPDLADLGKAVGLLESPSLIAKLSGFIGMPIELVLRRLPSGAADRVRAAAHRSLRAAFEMAIKTMGKPRAKAPHTVAHKIVAGAAGAAGGAFGLPALAVELPITTTIILRSVADIARNQGEDLSSIEARLACLEVFAHGGRSRADDSAESGYFAVRAALAQAVSEAATYVSRKAVVEEGAPALVQRRSWPRGCL
jgi:hypothetical protein